MVASGARTPASARAAIHRSQSSPPITFTVSGDLGLCGGLDIREGELLRERVDGLSAIGAANRLDHGAVHLARSGSVRTARRGSRRRGRSLRPELAGGLDCTSLRLL